MTIMTTDRNFVWGEMKTGSDQFRLDIDRLADLTIIMIMIILVETEKRTSIHIVALRLWRHFWRSAK